MDSNHNMVDQAYFGASLPFLCCIGPPVTILVRIGFLVREEPLIGKNASQQVSIWMSMIHIELLRHSRTFSMPSCNQDESTILQYSFSTVYRNCAH